MRRQWAGAWRTLCGWTAAGVPPLPCLEVVGMGMAKWREISGILVENEMGMGEEERRGGLRKLFRMAEAEMRSEMKRAAEDVENRSERTFLWEPIAAVCRRLEISQANL